MRVAVKEKILAHEGRKTQLNSRKTIKQETHPEREPPKPCASTTIKNHPTPPIPHTLI